MALWNHRHSADRLGHGVALAAVALGLAACTPSGAPPSAPATAQADPAQSRPPEPETAQPLPAASDPELCPHDDGPDTLRLPYDSFGPGAMAFGLLGQRWWQWDGEGHDFDDDRDVIWVVVHEGIDEAALNLRFPIRPDADCDHRYLTLEDAEQHLTTNIAELSGVAELAELRATLEQTQSSVRDHFAAAAQP